MSIIIAKRGDKTRRIPDTDEYRKAYKKLGYTIVEGGKAKATSKETAEAKTESKTDAKA